MPKRVRPYGSAEDAEAVRALRELTSAGGGLASVEDAREVITSLARPVRVWPRPSDLTA
jgi:hypothetical protein